MTKLCKDCKWCVGDDKYAECHAPQNKQKIKPLLSEATLALIGYGTENPDPEYQYRYIFCSTHRRSSWLGAVMTNACGATGRWWDKK